MEFYETGSVTNAKHAERRAPQQILQYITGQAVEPPFADWKVALY